MSMYIKGTGNISPQKSWNDEALLIQAFDYRGIRLDAVEPEYEEYLDPRQLRRMSRILKMGVTSAILALKDADVLVPDGIITGTGYGCIEDTSVFLARLTATAEQGVNPTPFIQSTHNTIGSFIAMLLQCQGYNQTYAHRAFSFESALIDAQMHLEENPDQKFLVGAVDEITSVSHEILTRFNVFRRRLASTMNLFRASKKGTVHGEGAAFFVLGGTKGANDLASVEAVRTFYKPRQGSIGKSMEVFIREAGLTPADIDLVVSGKTGHKPSDAHIDTVVKQVLPNAGVACFKHLSGEHPSASAFAVWMAARILSERHVPEVVVFRQSSRPLRHVLVYNTWFETHHTLILLRTCRATS